MEIRTLRATEHDLKLLKQCFDLNGSEKRSETLRWRYLENPTQTLLVDVAFDEEANEVAGVYCVSPVHMTVAGKTKLGAQSIDTLTDSRYRGQGLFRKLAARVYEECEEKRVALVYGFPNGNSAHGFFKRLSWTALDPVPFLIRPLRVGYLAERLGMPGKRLLKTFHTPLALRPRSLPQKGGELRAISSFGQEVDSLWDSFAGNSLVGIRRDSQYLEWRFFKNPDFRYRAYGYYEGGMLVGYVIFSVQQKHGGKVGYVMECLAQKNRHDVNRFLLRHAVYEMGQRDADVVLAWNLPHSKNHLDYYRSGFLPFPERFRPIELHFGARKLSAAGAANVCERTHWYLSYCDSDTV